MSRLNSFTSTNREGFGSLYLLGTAYTKEDGVIGHYFFVPDHPYQLDGRAIELTLQKLFTPKGAIEQMDEQRAIITEPLGMPIRDGYALLRKRLLKIETLYRHEISPEGVLSDKFRLIETVAKIIRDFIELDEARPRTQRDFSRALEDDQKRLEVWRAEIWSRIGSPTCFEYWGEDDVSLFIDWKGNFPLMRITHISREGFESLRPDNYPEQVFNKLKRICQDVSDVDADVFEALVTFHNREY